MPPEHFFSLGSWYHIPAEPVPIPPGMNNVITTDQLQQHLMRYGATQEDIGCIILLDLPCGPFPFTVGRLFNLNDDCHPFGQDQIYGLDKL